MNARRVDSIKLVFRSHWAAAAGALFLLSLLCAPAFTEPASRSEGQRAAGAGKLNGSNGKLPHSIASARLETYQDLIQKAQNLTLQRDRLQTSQVLLRALQREPRGTTAQKELVRALDELTAVFYTEKAQAAFVAGESNIDTRPRDAIASFQEALHMEDGNVAILKSMARAHLILGECAKAETPLKSAEGLNPYSAEVKLLRLQAMECSKSFDVVAERLSRQDSDLEPVEKYLRGLRIKDLLRRKEMKKIKALLAQWESQAPEYPEVYYWKWETSRTQGSADRAAALRYVQLCQNLTARKRKSYILDVDLCKGKDAVDLYLKETGFKPSAPVEEP